MKTSFMKSLLLVIITATTHAIAFSQELSTDSATPVAFKNVVAVYNSTLQNQLHIFNGKEYVNYRRPFNNGHPYFEFDSLVKGTVTYEGTTYNNVPMMYNIGTDEILILNNNNISRIQLIKDKVSNFSLLGHSFIHLDKKTLTASDAPPGYYDVLTTGKISLLAKRIKIIEQDLKQIIELKVFPKNNFYLGADNKLNRVNSKKEFLSLFPLKKKELQQFIRQNKLNYRRNKEDYMTMVTNYYNSITG